jgi:hypothetical protein
MTELFVKISVLDGIESMKICPVKIERVEAALANALKEMFPPHTVHSALDCTLKLRGLGG